jgi:hypothetical protein
VRRRAAMQLGSIKASVFKMHARAHFRRADSYQNVSRETILVRGQ